LRNSEDHIKVLRRLIMDTEGSAGEVIFTFDGDAAGQPLNKSI